MQEYWLQFHPDVDTQGDSSKATKGIQNLGPEVEEDNLDLANKSLLDTLRLGFYILMVIMGVLCVIFVVSGVFQVQKGKVAIKIRFGEIERDGDGRIKLYRSGVHWAWPEPFEEKIFVSLQTYSRDIDKQYWFRLAVQEVDKSLDELEPNGQGINPAFDGALLTGDQRFAHMKLSVQYQVDSQDPANIALFAQNVATTEELATRTRAWYFVETALAQALVRVASGSKSDDLWIPERFINHPQNGISRVQSLAQAELDRMETGIRITQLTPKQTVPPRDVIPFYREASTAQSKGNQRINEAREYQNKQMNVLVGQAHHALTLLIEWREEAIAASDDALLKLIESNLKLLYSREITAETAMQAVWAKKGLALKAEAEAEAKAKTELGAATQPADLSRFQREQRKMERAAQPVLVGGMVARVMNEARQYRSGAEQKLKGELELFRPWQAQIAKDPNVETTIRQTMLQQALDKIMSSPRVEIFQMPYDPSKNLEMIIKPDEKIRQKRKDGLEKEKENKQ